jgi:hypothetical protein
MYTKFWLENLNGRETVADSSVNGKIIYKGKAAPLQAWGGPEGSRKLR